MLTSKARGFLRSIGNDLDPVLFVGKGGLNDQIVAQADGVLETRELIKGRVLPGSGVTQTPSELAEAIAGRTGSDVVQVVGNNFLLFRRSSKKPRIELP